MSNIPLSSPKWLRFICIHNPFYLISACLVLYGLHISFDGLGGAGAGWQLMAYLCGYATLLLLVATLVVRFGQVWEDARMILLLIVLIFVAISANFDRACLDSPTSGARFLAAGFGFAVLLIELTLPCLAIRLPSRYRIPFYLQLGLLFVYPPWLAHLSVTDQEPRMTWYVMLFCCFAAATILLLMPAAMRAGRGEPPNGTPWRWPSYPWPLFVFVAVGMAVRAYGLSVSFELSNGLSAGFQAYMLVPLLGALLVVGFELCRTFSRDAATVVCALGVGLLALVWPGDEVNQAQRFMLDMLRERAGSPAQLGGWMLLVFYAYCWLRGDRLAEWLLALIVFFSAFVGPQSVNFDSLTAPNQPWMIAGILLLFARGVWMGCSRRTLLAVLVGLLDLHHVYTDTPFGQHHGYFLYHLGLSSALWVGLLFHDDVGRLVRDCAWYLILGSSLIGIVGYRFLFPDVLTYWHVLCLANLSLLSVFYWWRHRSPVWLFTVFVSLTCTASLICESIYRVYQDDHHLQAHRWLVAGWAALIVATMIGLIKGGIIPRTISCVAYWNVRWQRRELPPT